MAKPSLLVCDDDRLFVDALRLSFKGVFEIVHAENSDIAITTLKGQKADLALLDISMRSKTEGIKAIPRFLEIEPLLPIVMCSGHTQFELVRDSLKFGAVDYFSKSQSLEELKEIIDRHLYKNPTSTINTPSREVPLLGKSKEMTILREKIRKVRLRDFNVLITGEKGSGKEVVARLLRRSLPNGMPEPFQAVDSATIQSTMAESLLFGHEKGAFTGADKVSKGMFEEADGGMIYFDEISNMPIDIQSKLLRVLQEKEFRRVGSSKTISANFRVVAASNQNLHKMVEEGKFKDDLLDRLNVIPIQIPPLRQRVEDIPELIAHFAKKFSAPEGFAFSPTALSTLENYSWPGNVRELSNLVAYLVTMGSQPIVEISELPPQFQQQESVSQAHPFHGRKDEFEKQFLIQAYEKFGGNISKMAQELKLSRSHLYEKLKRYKIK